MITECEQDRQRHVAHRVSDLFGHIDHVFKTDEGIKRQECAKQNALPDDRVHGRNQLRQPFRDGEQAVAGDRQHQAQAQEFDQCDQCRDAHRFHDAPDGRCTQHQHQQRNGYRVGFGRRIRFVTLCHYPRHQAVRNWQSPVHPVKV